MSKHERLARLLKIIIFLKFRRNMHRRELAELCEVCVRTIQRDINTLCYAGVPIFWSEEDGYQIMPHFFLPPVNLTSEESFQLIVAARASAEDERKCHQKVIESAVSKIIAGLPDGTRHDLEAALDKVSASRRNRLQPPTVPS